MLLAAVVVVLVLGFFFSGVRECVNICSSDKDTQTTNQGDHVFNDVLRIR